MPVIDGAHRTYLVPGTPAAGWGADKLVVSSRAEESETATEAVSDSSTARRHVWATASLNFCPKK